jgi:hypothetical protein
MIKNQNSTGKTKMYKKVKKTSKKASTMDAAIYDLKHKNEVEE